MSHVHEPHHHDVVRPVRRASGVAWTALIFSLAALLLGFAAYDRTGGNVDERIRSGFTEVRQEADLRIARFEAAYELSSIQARVLTGQSYPEFETDVERVRGRLRDAYTAAKLEGSEEWRGADQTFDALIRDFKEGENALREELQKLIEDLRKATGT